MALASEPQLRVMLVDDHEGAREALARRLSADGRLVVGGHTAGLEEALRLVDECQPQVVLVDTRRRDDAGVAIIAALVALPERVRPLVVVHTSFFDPQEWRRSQTAGACDWVLKQIDVDSLYQRLIAAVHRGLPASRWQPVPLQSWTGAKWQRLASD